MINVIDWSMSAGSTPSISGRQNAVEVRLAAATKGRLRRSSFVDVEIYKDKDEFLRSARCCSAVDMFLSGGPMRVVVLKVHNLPQ